MDYAVHIFGALALIINFIGYRQETVNGYRLISAFALACLSIHFFMLGASAAGIGLAIGAVRNIVAIRYQSISVLLVFVLLNIVFCLWEWFVLQNSVVLFIAYTASLIFTVGSIILKSAHAIRRWFILAESLMLIYSILVLSPFGVLFNVSNLISIFLKLRSEKRLAAAAEVGVAKGMQE
ncbi:Bacterial inner membrane protein [Idiomarina sp. A28L]|uniref:YgjV family protein n=1 Tax=Idiomarina sp. A28L TaxID=1036674 RepID=UPI0002138886|nr:YgjV family protein [Idiomarina sp. A28L]EGN75738.1 Bacterial inner membrane protein [Idiomarina sp. A28L]